MNRRMKLIADIKAYCEATDTAPSTLCKLALHDRGFFNRLQTEGKKFYPETEDRLRAYMRANRKKKDGKPRPNLEVSAA